MLRAIWLLSVWGAQALFLAPLLPWTLIARDPKLLLRCGVGAGARGFRMAGLQAQVRMAEALDPAQPYLFLSNHASNLDPPLLAGVLAPRPVAMLIKQELLKIPLLGWGMRLAGFVAVARSGSLEDAKRSLGEAAAVLRSGTSLAVFVEGTRSLDGQLLPFKKGPFFLAMECGVPVVPVTLRGTGALLPKGRLRLKRGTVEVVLHKPLRPAEYPNREALKEAVRAAIASAL